MSIFLLAMQLISIERFDKANNVNKLWLVFFLFGAQAAAALAQGPAFVPQLSGGASVDLPQAGSSSGVFVEQLPPGAKPRPAPSAPAAPVMQQRNFIAQSDQGEDETLVIHDDPGLLPYTDGQRPALPVIGQGVTVSLQPNAESLPNVGAGAVIL